MEHCGKSFISVFQDFFASSNKTCILAGRLDARFRHFPVSLQSFSNQLVYTMFISNNHASFHLWWKENLENIKADSVTVVWELFINFSQWICRASILSSGRAKVTEIDLTTKFNNSISCTGWIWDFPFFITSQNLVAVIENSMSSELPKFLSVTDSIAARCPDDYYSNIVCSH